MLQGQYGGWDQDGRLFPIAGGLECGSYGDFRFAESHIPTDQAVHGVCLLHIRFDRFGCFVLIRGILVQKRSLQFMLQIIIRRKGMTSCCLATGIELNQVLGNVFDLGFGFGL